MNRNLVFFNILAITLSLCLPAIPIQIAGDGADVNGKVAGYSAESPALRGSSLRWDLKQIEVPQAWSVFSGGRGVVVAVLDTGIDSKHTDLKGKVLERISFVDSSGCDENGHGTHVAGIIAGSEENLKDVGVAYFSSLLDVQVAEKDGTSDAEKVAKGIFWAVDHGANVINISVVIGQSFSLLEDAVNYAWDHGCVIVAAAGNNASYEPVYPAAYPRVISVAATDKNDSLARWSNRGDWVTVAAPGVDIYSALPDNELGYKSGTSFSSALVSGEAALLYSRVKELNHDSWVNYEVRDIIISSYDELENGNRVVPRINVYKAALAEQALENSFQSLINNQ